MASANLIPHRPIWLLNLNLLYIVSAQGQTDSVCFDLSNAFDIVSHDIIFRNLGNFEHTFSHVDWFLSYVAKRQYFVRIYGTLSFSYLVKFGVPQGSTLGPVILQNLCIDNDTKLKLSETMITYFTSNTHSIYFNYKLRNNLISLSDCVDPLKANGNYKSSPASTINNSSFCIYVFRMILSVNTSY
jgi:hypothetical protein